MVQITRILSAACVCLSLFAASVPCQEPASSPAGTVPDNDFAARVRGRVITHFEVERECERLKKLAPDIGDEELRWEARRALAEQILLIETAKNYTKKITDEMIRRNYVERGYDENLVRKHLVKLREEFVREFYVRARLGRTDQLPGVIPDMASFILVSPEDIRNYYNYNRKNFIRKGKTTLVWILFPATAFSDPADRLQAAEDCRTLLKGPETAPGEFAERWPGCIFQEEEVIAGGDKKFLPPLMGFVEKGKTGDVSDVIALQGGLIVSRIIEKIAEKTFSFNEVQAMIATRLTEGKLMQARRIITRDLTRKERIFWPVDLFDRNAGKRRRPAPPAKSGKAKENP